MDAAGDPEKLKLLLCPAYQVVGDVGGFVCPGHCAWQKAADISSKSVMA
jgi:hypothetical protein